MGKNERKGARRDRSQRAFKRIPELGYYLVVTDAQATEVNYLNGFRDSIPVELRDRLVIKVITTPTSDLLEKCLELAAVEPQYRKPWIVFDRDKVKDFNQIIADAGHRSVHVGWSNPCLEIWFHAYFGDMPVNTMSSKCISVLGTAFQRQTGQEYSKTDKDVYRKLYRFGNEKIAIKIAKDRHQHQGIDAKPSEMLSTTTLYMLIEEIRKKTEAQREKNGS
jgi:hypothetical protein